MFLLISGLQNMTKCKKSLYAFGVKNVELNYNMIAKPSCWKFLRKKKCFNIQVCIDKAKYWDGRFQDSFQYLNLFWLSFVL